MPAFEWSKEHNAYIKQCCTPGCKRVYIGTEDQVESVEIFSKYFKYHATTVDNFQSRCRNCERAHKRGSKPFDQEKLLVFQGNVCFLCDKSIIFDGTTNACVDHDHETGEVRGILCNKCNTTLGFIERLSIEDFHKMQDYIHNPPAERMKREVR